MKRGMMRRIFTMLLCAGLGWPLASQAVPRSWTGGGDGRSWSDPNNWNPANTPQIGDDVTISGSGSTTVLLASASAALNSFTLTNATLVCTNWDTLLSATTVAIWSNGIVTLPTVGATIMSNRVWIACVDLALGTGGRIDVNQKGYPRAKGPSAALGFYYSAGGGGYGGFGGDGTWSGGGKTNYGSAASPIDMGSGGCDNYEAYGYGNSGGGGVKIEATGTVTINGTISADGGTATYAGGGAGGSVWISAGTLQGTGTVEAVGGYGNAYCGGGGGGRISFNGVTVNNFAGTISVSGGASAGGGAGHPGTFYPIPVGGDFTVTFSLGIEADNYTFNNLVITNNAILECRAATNGVAFTYGTGVVLNVANLTVASGAKLAANDVGFPGGYGPAYGQGGYYSGGGGGHGGYGGDGSWSGGGKVYYPRSCS